MNDLLSTKLLSKTFVDGSGNKIQILKNINFSLAAGKSLAIIGKSGSGKSTLLHLLGILDKPTEGTIFFQGEDVLKRSSNGLAEWRNQYLGFIFQFHHLLNDFSALENVMMPSLILGEKPEKTKKRATHLLKETQLGHRLHQKTRLMSGGELQRAAIARALMNRPKLILADEPTGNLDRENGNLVLNILQDACEQHQSALIMVTHNQEFADKLGDCRQLNDGFLV